MSKQPSSSPPVGVIAYGKTGQACTVKQIDGERVVLNCPSGPVNVPLSAVVRWEMPASPPTNFNPAPPIEIPPSQFQPGDQVRYLGRGKLSSLLRPLLMGKILTVKSIQRIKSEGDWVTCAVPNGLDQTVPIGDLES